MPSPSVLEAALQAAQGLALLLRSLRVQGRPPRIARTSEFWYDVATRLLGGYDDDLDQWAPAIEAACDLLPKESVEFCGQWDVNLPASILKAARYIRDNLEVALRDAHLDDHFDRTPDEPYTKFDLGADGVAVISLADVWTEKSWAAMQAVFARIPDFKLDQITTELARLSKEAKPSKTRLTVAKANEKAMKLARQMRAGFFALSERQQAKLIGCSWKTWSKTTFYPMAQEKRPAGKRQKPSSPKTESLTAEREAVTGEGERDEVLRQLIAEQEADKEPSPLESDSLDRPRKIHFRKRL